MKETKRELIIRCNCGGDHFFSISHWYDDDYIFSVEADLGGFWFRLRMAFKYVFKNSCFICRETILTKRDLKKIKKFLEAECKK